MKYVTDTTRRFQFRPHFEPAELDFECEDLVSKFLTESYGCIRLPFKTDDVEVFLERHVSNFEPYADLSNEGESVEGMTVFNPIGKPDVFISSSISEDDRRKNRYRTTLAHEFGHVWFHNVLYQRDENEVPLFSTNNAKQSCNRDSILRGIDWMEWQAGYVCGALLMPVTWARRVAASSGLTGTPIDAKSEKATLAIAKMVEAFDVSQEAASVRLQSLGFVTSSRQAPLFR